MSNPNPIENALSFDADIPLGRQDAWVATIRILVPCEDVRNNPVRTQAEAFDYISETLRGQFLDWEYAPQENSIPVAVTVCEPYVEGSFEQ